MAGLASLSCNVSLFVTRRVDRRAVSSNGAESIGIPALRSTFSLSGMQMLKLNGPDLNTRKKGGCYRARASLRVATSATSMGLEVVETLQPNSRVNLSVTVPPNVCKDTYNEVIKEFTKKANVPGFRPGKKVPEGVLVNFIGLQKVKASAVEAILKRTLPEALSSVANRALKDSEHIVTKFQDLEASFAIESPLSYDVAVDVCPELKWSSEKAYKNLKVTVELDTGLPPQEAADAEFKSRVKDLGSLQIAPDRGIEWGDVAIIDISANRLNADGSEGEKVLSAEQKGFQLDTDDFANFIPGFVDALINLRRGETRSFDLPFPKTWQQAPLRGINARFTAVCKENFVRILPELDDSIAPKLVEGLTTLDEVRKVLLEKHTVRVAEAKAQQTHFAVTEELAKVVDIDVPNSLLEEQGRQMYAAKLIEMQTTAKLTKEQVVQFSSEEMVNNFLTSQKEKIRRAVRQTLAVAEVFKLENLMYSEEELQAEVQAAKNDFKLYNQEFDEQKVKEQAEEFLEGAKVLDFLMENSEITYVNKASQT